MLELPGELTAETFLARHWQKKPLFMPAALERMTPTITRNELAWLATLDDVESRIVFTRRTDRRTRYQAETGPFDETFLGTLPKRDWTLLVHDVEKHLPAMRKLFEYVPFIPDWRIDDLMISFAAPGGGVGPHRDNYDVFLCQGIGTREWRYTLDPVEEDPLASDDLALLQEFDGGERLTASKGDVLYLPPGVAHWGTAQRACLTYSIGMRAPPCYADPDLSPHESRPGYLSPEAKIRAGAGALSLGQFVTELKDWLQPQPPGDQEITALLRTPALLKKLELHGMTRIAYDDENLYVNGAVRSIDTKTVSLIGELCRRRRLSRTLATALEPECLRWLLARGAFELPADV